MVTKEGKTQTLEDFPTEEQLREREEKERSLAAIREKIEEWFKR
jgi:hypothetical protein